MSLEQLKSLPCPAGDECTAFACLFGHAKDLAAASVPVPSPAADRATTARPDGDQDAAALHPTRPRKRLKAEPPASPSPPRPAAKASPSARAVPLRKADTPAAPGGAAQPKAVPGVQLASATRPVSPPSVKRNLNPRPADVTKGSPASQSSTPRRTPLHPPSPSPRKPESLNPRLLRAAPANHAVRFKLLKLLHAEFARLNAEVKKSTTSGSKELVLSDQDLIFRALDMEEKMAKEKPSIYTNVIKGRIVRYRRMTAAQWVEERQQETKASENAVGTVNSMEASALGQSKEISTGLPDALEVAVLRRLVTPITELAEYDYVPTVPKPEDIEKARLSQEAAKGWERCDRCTTRFQVFPGRRESDGALASGGKCTYHWGRTYFTNQNQQTRDKAYKCCGESVGDSIGCVEGEHHVFKHKGANQLAVVTNFVETPPNDLTPADRAVCFDCEMCYTVYGMELVRLTATSWPAGELLLDILVKPKGEILDLNSRFSGVWPEEFANAETWISGDSLVPAVSVPQPSIKKVSSPEQARSLLFSLMNPNTPLIGHGLENDLNSVRMIHPTLVDTILLYPHKRGLPYRNGLKMLMETTLNRLVQVDDGAAKGGHDSAEDARAAGDLARYKVMKEWERMQMDGWTLANDEFVAPKKRKAADASGDLTEEVLEGTATL